MSRTKPLIIAIDGYSSCGKSTVARQLASYFNFIYIDTGAMYRAVTLFFLSNEIDMESNEAVENALNNIEIDFKVIHGAQIVHLNGEAVENQIRSQKINNSVSEVAQISSVRRKMVKLQRVMSENRSVVMDGRDIGTVVFPNADIKIFITADIEVRTIRRFKELVLKGQKITKAEVRENLQKRDYIDSTRKDSPLTKASDAILIDNTRLTKDEQLDLLIEIVNSKITS